jgi:nucleotide-binding universal stress UspA family protein
MERILVGIDASRPSWESLVRALCLAQRIEARVSVLVVFEPNGKESAQGRTVLGRVEAEMESAKAAGANVELYLAEGRYDRVVIDAAGQLKTTLLVAPAAGADEQGGERETGSLGRILGGVDCRVELVSPRKHHERKKDGT